MPAQWLCRKCANDSAETFDLSKTNPQAVCECCKCEGIAHLVSDVTVLAAAFPQSQQLRASGYYPEPDHSLPLEAPKLWTRGRVVIPCVDFAAAQEIAAKVAELAACDAEAIVGITDPQGERLLGETVTHREFYSVRINGREALAVAESVADGLSEIDETA